LLLMLGLPLSDDPVIALGLLAFALLLLVLPL